MIRDVSRKCFSNSTRLFPVVDRRRLVCAGQPLFAAWLGPLQDDVSPPGASLELYELFFVQSVSRLVQDCFLDWTLSADPMTNLEDPEHEVA